MGQETTTIATVRFYRQDNKPPSAPDGATWITQSDGVGEDTSSRYTYDAENDVWELDSAVGPSKPNAGELTAGAAWRDTGEGVPKQYDGSTFVSLIAKSIQDVATDTTTISIDENDTSVNKEVGGFITTVDYTIEERSGSNTTINYNFNQNSAIQEERSVSVYGNSTESGTLYIYEYLDEVTVSEPLNSTDFDANSDISFTL